MIASFLASLSLLGVFYAYFGYAIVLALTSFVRKKPISRVVGNQSKNDTVPSWTVIIAARNEEQHIAAKLEHTLSLIYQGVPLANVGVQVIVASDASEDRTDEIVKLYAAKGLVTLVRLDERGGKERALKEAVKSATGDLLLFTDTKVVVEPQNALNLLSRYFADETVGAVSTTDRLGGVDNGQAGEGLYVRYEMALRRLESNCNSLVGLSGSCFAVRREIAEDLREDLGSDFSLLLSAVRRGKKGIIATDVFNEYGAVRSEKEEFARKVRTVLRGMQTFWRSRDILSNDFFSFQLISHKLCRWLVPWWLILLLFSSLNAIPSSSFWGLMFIAQMAFYGVAVAAYFNAELLQMRLFRVALFFVISNVAILIAWAKFLIGRHEIKWEPSKKC